MKIRKITALAIGAAMIGSVMGAGAVAAQKVYAPNGIPNLNINNVEIVLPTTPEVNGIPLHIKNDAATAVLLVTDIYQDSVLMDIQTLQKSLAPVEAGGQLSNMIKYTGVNGATNHIIGIVSNVQGDGTTNPDVDIDFNWYIPQLNAPIVPLNASLYDSNGNPLDNVAFGVDFDQIVWIDPANDNLNAIEKEHVGEWELKDGAIKIGWALEWSPLKPNANDDVVLSTKTVDDQTINVIYYYKNYQPNENPANVPLGGSENIGGWTIKPLDVDINQGTALVLVKSPSGATATMILKIDQTAPYHYIFWINKQGELVHWSDYALDSSKTTDIYGDGSDQISATDPDGVVKQLEQAGIGTILVVSPTNEFIGINGTKTVSFELSAKELKNTYQDGEKVVDIFPELKNFPDYKNWYLKIDASNPDQPIVYFVWKSEYDPTASDYSSYPPVFFKPGDKIYIPIPYFKNVGTEDEPEYKLETAVIALEMNAQLDDSGKYYTEDSAEFYIEYYKDTQKYYSKNSVDNSLEQLMNQIQSTDPAQALITDENLLNNGFQAGKDYVIIGGWVSNKAWKLLEKYYPNQVAEMKQYLLNEISKNQGDYVVFVLPNPADSNHVIIVAAGTDHEQTAKAVQYIIKNMGK